MNSPAKDIASHIAANALGTLAGTSDWGVYINDSPSEPNNCITVYDTGGPRNFPDQLVFENLIQVEVRTSAWQSGYDKMESIKDLLILPKSVVINATKYVGIWLMSDVATIGRDQKNRQLLVCNFRLIRELS